MAEDREIPLDDGRIDQWYRDLQSDQAYYDHAVSLIGEPLAILCAIADVRVLDLKICSTRPDASLVQVAFREGELEIELFELRRRVSTLLCTPLAASNVPLSDELDAVIECIGLRYLLLAAAFGMDPKIAVLSEQRVDIVLDQGGKELRLPLSEFHELIHHQISMFTRSRSPEAHSFSLEDLPRALAAQQQENWSEVIDILAPWLQPVAQMFREGRFRFVEIDARQEITQGLRLLSQALTNSGDARLADEILRLCVQICRGDPWELEVYRQFAELCIQRQRFGEAIAPLRRTIALGAEETKVLPLLARSFLEVKQRLAAAACLEQLRTTGAHDAQIEPFRERLAEGLGEPWSAFQDFLAH